VEASCLTWSLRGSRWGIFTCHSPFTWGAAPQAGSVSCRGREGYQSGCHERQRHAQGQRDLYMVLVVDDWRLTYPDCSH
jgi:hypothetical protein